jgi:hypothetical protein
MINGYNGNHWFMVKEPMKGIEIACFRVRGLAEDYVKWHAAGLVLNPSAYQIVECTIEAEEK